jgi:5'-methylthioadenosine phosphorylase
LCNIGLVVGVFGGSGFYSFLEDVETIEVETPYGDPSASIAIGDVGGARVAFLPRHGVDHELPPHRIPYRANLWALRSLGVRQVLGPSAVGSLTPACQAGTLVVPDQIVDRTTGRVQTYYDAGGPVHVAFADPYCPRGRAAAIAAARAGGWEMADAGTLVVIDGPRFSTRAESQWYAAQGWTLVGMTGHPEAVLARELALCYVPLALVTDTDAGVTEGEGVTQEEVFRAFGRNVARPNHSPQPPPVSWPFVPRQPSPCANLTSCLDAGGPVTELPASLKIELLKTSQLTTPT